MTETDWLNSTDPQAMLTFLRESGKLSERKARLFAAACCRRIWHLLTDERSRRAVQVAERYADKRATGEELMSAARTAAGVVEGSGNAHDAISTLMEMEEVDASEVAMFAATAIECSSEYQSFWDY